MTQHETMDLDSTGCRSLLVVDEGTGQHREMAGVLDTMASFSVTYTDRINDVAAVGSPREQRFDALVLALGGTRGAELCARLRQGNMRIPILIVGDAADEAAVVHGLAAGANDYIAAPARPRELVARINAQIRAHETSEHAVVRIGPYHFHPSGRSLYNPTDKRRIRLTDKEAAVLKYLYRAAGVPVGRQQLLREVWGYSAEATTHTVETHIYRLRRKIEPLPTSMRILVNEEGGYRLAPQVAGSNESWEEPSTRHHTAPAVPMRAMELAGAS